MLLYTSPFYSLVGFAATGCLWVMWQILQNSFARTIARNMIMTAGAATVRIVTDMAITLSWQCCVIAAHVEVAVGKLHRMYTRIRPNWKNVRHSDTFLDKEYVIESVGGPDIRLLDAAERHEVVRGSTVFVTQDGRTVMFEQGEIASVAAAVERFARPWVASEANRFIECEVSVSVPVGAETSDGAAIEVSGRSVNLAASGGTDVLFEGNRLFTQNFFHWYASRCGLLKHGNAKHSWKDVASYRVACIDASINSFVIDDVSNNYMKLTVGSTEGSIGSTEGTTGTGDYSIESNVRF